MNSGWVREPWVKEVSSGSVVQVFYSSSKTCYLFPQVNHSQSLNKPPFDLWILCKSDGDVAAAHCTCMAGNGEVCSHVAALLFYIKYNVCVAGVIVHGWRQLVAAKAHQESDARSIAAIDFASSTMKKRCLGANATATCEPKAHAQSAAPTGDEWMCSFTTLVDQGNYQAVTSTDPASSDLYVPAVRHYKRADLRRLYSHSAQRLSYHEPLEECHKIYARLDINEKVVCSIESRTRSQNDYSVVHISSWRSDRFNHV